MKELRYLLSVIGLLCVLPSFAAQVPKPSIRFYVTYANGSEKQAVYLILHREADTSGTAKGIEWPNPAGEFFDTSEVCKNATFCQFSSHLRKYHQLVFLYSDSSKISQEIEPDAYHSAYEVYVNGSGFDIKNVTPWFLRTGKPYSMYRTAILSVVVELLVLWLVLLIVRYPDKKRFLLGMFLANLIALPVFFGLMELSDTSLMWFLAEAVMIGIETVFVWWFMKRAATPGKMTLLVFLLNLFSVFAGGAALFFAMLFGQDIIQYLH